MSVERMIEMGLGLAIWRDVPYVTEQEARWKMVTVAAADVAKNFGEWHDRALNEPVVVTKYGRESVVVLSVDTFRQLTSHYREVVDTSEMDEIVAEGIEHSDIPEEYRWNSTDEDVPNLRRGM